jgi:hypothetical protein
MWHKLAGMRSCQTVWGTFSSMFEKPDYEQMQKVGEWSEDLQRPAAAFAPIEWNHVGELAKRAPKSLSEHPRPGLFIHRFRDHERECSDGSWDLWAKFYFPKASSDSNFRNKTGTGWEMPHAKPKQHCRICICDRVDFRQVNFI